MSESVSFDRIADTYDDTRGGLARGRTFATNISAQLDGAREVLEIGVGTGAIALPLIELGHDVVGCDLSPAMLAHAYWRLGARVAVADAMQLPFASESRDAVVAVWVFHLVADQVTVLRECARVLRPGGRLAVSLANADEEPSDVNDILLALHEVSGRRRDLPPVDGLTQIYQGPTDIYTFDTSPNDVAATIESRTWSWLWDLDDTDWARIVQPSIDALRALPEPERPRRRVQSHPLLVFEK